MFKTKVNFNISSSNYYFNEVMNLALFVLVDGQYAMTDYKYYENDIEKIIIIIDDLKTKKYLSYAIKGYFCIINNFKNKLQIKNNWCFFFKTIRIHSF